MNENRPTAASLNGARDTSTLQFADGTQAEFFLRGGVCFPSEVAGQARGHLVLVGLDVRRSVLLVFEETPFYQVANQVSESGRPLARAKASTKSNSASNCPGPCKRL